MSRYCGRDFSETEISRIRRLIKDNPGFHRAELSRQVCHTLQWLKPDGKLKEMSCRVAMLRMHEDRLIDLPPPRRTKAVLRKIVYTPATNQQPPIVEPVHKLGPLRFTKVERADSSLWNEYIERYHYLGYKTLPGAQLRYFISLDQQIIALLGFGAAAWQTEHIEINSSVGLINKENATYTSSLIMLDFSFCLGYNRKIWLQKFCPWQLKNSLKIGRSIMEFSLC